MIVKNLSKNTILADKCKLANTFVSRFVGLMGKKVIMPGEGIHIIPCNSIHMFFMKFPIDVVFINKDNVVVETIENIMPWKVSKIIHKAHSVIEVPVGTINRTNTCVSDILGDSYQLLF